MRKITLYIFIFLLVGSSLRAQDTTSTTFDFRELEPSFELSFYPGITLGAMPVVGLEYGHLATFGLEGTLVFTPLKTKYGSYSYFLSRTEGHFFSTANRFISRGHRLSLGIDKIKLITEFSKINRLYISDAAAATNENISRITIGIGVQFNEDYMLRLGLLREDYDYLPNNDLWEATSLGGKIEFVDDLYEYAIQFELLPHPRFHANVITSGLGDFTTSGYWGKLTVVKTLTVIDKSYIN
jgi:hypothetical protein